MSDTTRRRLLLWTLPVMLLLASLLFLFLPRPIEVDLATVDRGPLQVTISEEGEARVRDVFVVSAPISGLLRRVELDAGDEVAANQTVIARLEPSVPMLLDERATAEARASVDAAAAAREFARAQIRRSQAEQEFADAELQRLQALAREQSVAQNDVDAARRRAKTARAALAEAHASLKMRNSEYAQARARLLNPTQATRAARECDCILVRSPVSGSVLQVIHRSEAVVAAGTPLVQIGDPRDLEVHVDLLSADAVRVRSGQRVSIDGWGGPNALHGSVRRVEPFGYTKVSALGIEEQRVNVIIDLLDPPQCWSTLNHGYQVEPHIVIWEAQDTLRVPLAALFRDGERWAVFVEREGRAVLRVVQTDHQNGTHARVSSGLAVGERIVLHPNERVVSGARITAREMAKS